VSWETRAGRAPESGDLELAWTPSAGGVGVWGTETMARSGPDCSSAATGCTRGYCIYVITRL
jgi:hypothetical protein